MSENTHLTANFIEEQINEDNKTGKYGGRVHTRFPPEPNGYLHVGHAKAILINYNTAKKYGGRFNLRFDDTNPAKEDEEFVESIMEDIKWLGCDWDEGPYFASDYFEKMYECAELLINKGKAFICELTAEEIREYRGTLTEPGKESPYRNRPTEESLALFRKMRAGELPDGACVLRAKIDMASPNITLRDPVIYRISHAHHHRQGNKWQIYPMYDFAHPLEDAIEGITHSLCSLEFENNRPLYDWVLRECEFENPPMQIEFARLNLTNTIMSKRYLRRLVEEGFVDGWDDPRMPTLAGMRRRGYTPAAIREFMGQIGVAKSNSVVDSALLEYYVREDLGATAPRAMAVLEPLKVTLTNWEEGKIDQLVIENHPDHPGMGTRTVPFSGVFYIERSDFMEDAPKKFFRLAPGREVRLKSAYIIKCEEVIKDAEGHVTELKCSVDLESRSGMPGSARKVKGTLHWVDAVDASKAVIRLYDYMLKDDEESDEEKKDYIALFNDESKIVCTDCLIESALAKAKPSDAFQFMRQGYFVMDQDSDKSEIPVFNRVVGLKDTWAKLNK